MGVRSVDWVMRAYCIRSSPEGVVGPQHVPGARLSGLHRTRVVARPRIALFPVDRSSLVTAGILPGNPRHTARCSTVLPTEERAEAFPPYRCVLLD